MLFQHARASLLGGLRSLTVRLRPHPGTAPLSEPTAAPLGEDLLSAAQLDALA